MLTQAMEFRPEMGFDSYDRFFPSQDTMPKGGFGNLIALPLQKKAREKGNSLFVDGNMNRFPDQWAFLSSVHKMDFDSVQSVVDMAVQRGGVLGVRFVSTDEDEISPWLFSPSGTKPEIKISEPLPEKVDLVLGNHIYIDKEGLPPSLENRLIRLAAFQNPEFYKAQAMRFATYDKPRIIHCCEDFPKHIGLPRGCFEDVVGLLGSLGVDTIILDERFGGIPIDVQFNGTLRTEQQVAAHAMLAHDAGVLSASTAFGKTVIAAYLIAKRGVNTLVVVHRKQLLDQWLARLGNFLDGDDKQIGKIGGGKRKPTGVIDVAMIQSLSKKGVVDEIVADYEGRIRYLSSGGHVQKIGGVMSNEGDFLLEVNNAKTGIKKRTHILFHGGNKVHHSKGCILFGPVKKQNGKRIAPEPLQVLRKTFYGDDNPISCPDKNIKIYIINDFD